LSTMTTGCTGVKKKNQDAKLLSEKKKAKPHTEKKLAFLSETELRE